MPRPTGVLRPLPRLSEVEAVETLHRLEIDDCLGIRAPREIGWVALVHRDREAVDRDLALLRSLEAGGLYAIDPAQGDGLQ